MTDFYVTYSEGPRYVDGVNLDADVVATFPGADEVVEISEPVAELLGRGYEPGQKNRDGSEL